MRRMTLVGVGMMLMGADVASAQTPATDVAAEVRAQAVTLRAALALRADEARATTLAARARTAEAQAMRAAVASMASQLHGVGARATAPEPWLAQDPADSLYRAAREALNARRFEEAARHFASLRERHPRSGYVPDAYYFQALALYRAGSESRLDQARELLALQRQRHPEAGTAADARALEVRIQSELARRGNAEAAISVRQSASASCDDEDQAVRTMALSALLQMDAERAVPILREVLRERDECSAALRKQAVFLIAQKMTDETVDVLLDLAHRNPDPDAEVREAAVFWLSQVDRPEAVDALIGILGSSDASPELRERVVFALGQHTSPRSTEALRDFVRDEGAPNELRANALFWMSQRGDEASTAFVRELYASLENEELKERALFAIAQHPTPEARAWLLARARDGGESVEVRKKALFWAGQAGLGASEAAELYRSSTDAEMKEQALFVLMQLREDREEAVDLLMDIARNEQDRRLRERAIFWLGQSDDPRVAPFLLELVRGG